MDLSSVDLNDLADNIYKNSFLIDQMEDLRQQTLFKQQNQPTPVAADESSYVHVQMEFD